MVRTMTARAQPSRKLRISLFVTAIAALGLAAPAHPQSGSVPPQSSQIKAPAYDVVSVKPHRPSDATWSFGPTPNGDHDVNATASQLIQYAYNLTLPDQISGLPGWATDARFDFEAKMDEETLAEFRKLSPEQQREQRLLMLQAVLADRFKLKVHHEIKEQPIYELVVAKGGSKFKESPSGEPQRMMTGTGRIVIQAMPVVNVADDLSYETGRIVIDKTGLAGNYDLTMKWTPEGVATSNPGAPPDLFTALEEQLGLKLVSAKGPVDVIVVDHIEKPTEN